MKKIFGILLLASLVVMLQASAVMAAPAPKAVDVTLTASAATVKVGETVQISAVTDKQGSAYSGSWSGAQEVNTVFADGQYVSTAEFTAAQPGIYNVTYDILMEAGSSGVSFTGTGTVTIEVIAPAVLKGVEVRNISAIPRSSALGVTTSYAAAGDVYLIWSDNTSTLYGTVYFNFALNQTIRSLNVTVIVDGKTYSYPVTVAMPEQI